MKGCGSSFAFFYFIFYVVLTQMLMINLFVAFVIQAYTQAYKDSTSYPSIDDFTYLTQLWVEYDPEGSGLIKPKDIPFLIYELPGELGLKAEYEEILKGIHEKQDEENINGVKMKYKLTNQHKYAVNVERNMVLPEAKSAKMFQKLKLNLYADPNGNKCHFKDVCLALTKDCMMKKGFTDI